MLCVFLLEIGRILSKIVSFEEFAALDFFVVLFSLSERLFESHLFSFQPLDLLHLLVFLLLSGLCLTAINSKFVVSLLWLDFALKNLTFALQLIFVGSESLQLSLGSLWFIKDHLNALQPIFFVGELTPDHIVKMLSILSRLIA